MPNIILEGPLQTSSLTWNLVSVEVPYPHKGLASSLRHGTSWERPNIMPHLIFEEPLQTSSLIWDLVFVEALYPHKGLASSLRHGTSLGKAKYCASSDIGRASTNKLPYLGLSFYRSAIPTQGPSLFIKACH
ncbi:hypothetical protein Adt_33186 [Abeliophyllum distichum]|uniref:Uncharacterized protein n=1 Tax=Abeliophyllum distichum TaxID=126358 RepID=A0ABD1QVI1_9LAMI